MKQEEPPQKCGAGCMKGDFHLRYRENAGVILSGVTRPEPIKLMGTNDKLCRIGEQLQH